MHEPPDTSVARQSEARLTASASLLLHRPACYLHACGSSNAVLASLVRNTHLQRTNEQAALNRMCPVGDDSQQGWVRGAAFTLFFFAHPRLAMHGTVDIWLASEERRVQAGNRTIIYGVELFDTFDDLPTEMNRYKFECDIDIIFK